MCVHNVHGGEVGLHSPLLVELQLNVFVIHAANFRAAKGDSTNRPYLPTCKAKADDQGGTKTASTYYTLLRLPYNTMFLNLSTSEQA